MTKRKYLLMTLVGSMLGLPLLSGCSGQAPPLTPQERASFKGGPMPESARIRLQQQLGRKIGGPPPNANQPPNAPANGGPNTGH